MATCAENGVASECPALDFDFMPCPDSLDVGFDAFSAGSDETGSSGDVCHHAAGDTVVALPRCCSSTAISMLPMSGTLKNDVLPALQHSSQGALAAIVHPNAATVAFMQRADGINGGETLALCGIAQEAATLSELPHIDEPLGAANFEEAATQSDWYSGESSADDYPYSDTSMSQVCKNEVSSHAQVSQDGVEQRPTQDQPADTELGTVSASRAALPNTVAAGENSSPSPSTCASPSGVQAQEELTASAFHPGLASLQQQFKAHFGRTTNSTNVHWLQQRIYSVSCGPMPVPSSPGLALAAAPVSVPPQVQVAAPVPSPADVVTCGLLVTPPSTLPKVKVQAQTEKKGSGTNKKRKSVTPEPATPSLHARDGSSRRTSVTSVTTSPKKFKPETEAATSVSGDELMDENVDCEGASESEEGVSTGSGKGKRKNHNPWYRFWTLEETQALVDGVAKCGGGKWADIKKLSFSAIDKRSAVDLKDKWRNLIRIAMLPPEQVKLDKKREATCPPELLQQVREISRREELRRHSKVDGRMNRGRPRSSTSSTGVAKNK